MHEVSIAQAIIDSVRQVKQVREKKIIGINIRLGEWSHLKEDNLNFVYQVMVAESKQFCNSSLNFDKVQAQSRCRDCHQIFTPRDYSPVCPNCSSIDTELIAGRELEIISVEVED